MENVRVRARSTFNSKYGMVRGGEIFWSEPDYAKDQERLGHVTIEPLADREPSRRQSIPAAPSTGKEPATESPPDPLPAKTSGARMGSGAAKPRYASPRGPRSRERT